MSKVSNEDRSEEEGVYRALRLYREVKYRQAYHVFGKLARQHPEYGNLYLMAGYTLMLGKGSRKTAEYLLSTGQSVGHSEYLLRYILGDPVWGTNTTTPGVPESSRDGASEAVLCRRKVLAENLRILRDAGAVNAWREAVEAAPGDYEAKLALARTLTGLGKVAEAKSLMKDTEHQCPEDAILVYETGVLLRGLEEYTRSVQYMVKASELGYPQNNLFLSSLAWVLAASGNVMLSIETLAKAQRLTTDEREMTVYRDQCTAYVRDVLIRRCANGNDRTAYDELKCALDVLPGNGRLLACMGELMISRMHDIEAGKKYFDEAFSAGGYEDEYLWGIKGATWYDYLGEEAEGIRCLEEAVRLDRSANNLLHLAHRIRRANPDRAKTLIYEAYEKMPDDFNILYQLAEIEIEQGDVKKGVTVAEKAIKMNPADGYAKTLAALGYYKKKNYAKALTLYMSALECGDKDEGCIYSAVSETYYQLGNFAKAREYAVLAVDINPDDAEAKNVLERLK